MALDIMISNVLLEINIRVNRNLYLSYIEYKPMAFIRRFILKLRNNYIQFMKNKDCLLHETRPVIYKYIFKD